jgi:hypothetical protein
MRSNTTTIETSITVDRPIDALGPTGAGATGAVGVSEGGPKATSAQVLTASMP